MPSTLESAEARWMTQLKEMREAIASLKLPASNQELDAEIDEVLSSSSGVDDVWDLISDSEELSTGEESELDSEGSLDDVGGPAYNQEWLFKICDAFSSKRSGLDTHELHDQINALLVSDSNDEELQGSLVDMLGFDDLDVVIEIMSHRRELSSPNDNLVEIDGKWTRLQNKQQREVTLRQQANAHRNAPLAPALNRSEPKYPHVYNSQQTGNMLSMTGKKFSFPKGYEKKDNPNYEEHIIPAAKVGTVAREQKLVQIQDLDGLCRATFRHYKSLNRMQSLVYPVAYNTSENMLICAPTGAGKTDAAMLTILNAISKNVVPNPREDTATEEFTTQFDDFKVVYIAPMKALAAEITEKFQKRLAWLGVQAREFTGDMQLTKKEIMETQIIVSTPEKWDVVTRKSTGDTQLVQKVRLLIIDEVHMLHDERGAVIESIVARTQRQVESTQSMIRIIGLSATLPNYIDVADFLKVNRMVGLYYFDASFRPVPLEQHFIGIKGKAGSKQSRERLEATTFEKVKEMLQNGHQVMVFVHSRKDTVLTAKAINHRAVNEGCDDLFSPHDQEGYSSALRRVRTAKSRELKDLIPQGLGAHNAGMSRSDRNLVEELFAEGIIRVLCCTATLAWGVNLPAAAVIIKGTQLYSAQDGKFISLGILDVLQIFGRAGRPQFEDTGIGFICTTEDKLQYYLSAITQQQPIESKFSRKLVDNLNAEVALGTVTSISDAVQWIGYSYLFVRMQRNPLTYGIDYAEARDDPQLIGRRRKLVTDAARELQRSQMIIFNESTEELRAKDVGRIASQFYVRQSSIKIFNENMKPQATEADVLRMISLSAEFDNVQFREDEAQELTNLRKEATCTDIDGKFDDAHTKTNILLQAYISRARTENFALVSDTAYIAQNAARICRALFMVALGRGWGFQCLVLLSLCKSIEKQIWPFQHPLRQFELPAPVIENLEKSTTSTIEKLCDLEPAEIGQLIHNLGQGKKIARLLKNFPTVSIEVEIAPLNRDVLRMKLHITPDFSWNDRLNGVSESYWIWVENSVTSEIYHHEFFILSRKKMYDDHELNFTIPLSDPLPEQIYVRAISDRWLGAETVTPVSFQHLIRPDTESVYTDLLNLQPLSILALHNPLLEDIYGQRFKYFNPLQTQIFHTMYHTSENVLLGSPTGSGKTVAAELAMWWAFREKPGSKVVYIAPMKALVRERVDDWQARLAQPMGLKLVELTGDNTPDTRSIHDADIIITTPEKWDGISRSWQTRGYVRQVSLIIIDEIHLLGGDRGPILEIIVSRMNYIASQSKGSVRIVGMSTACANATDLANWLRVKHGLFNFRHSVRPVPLEIYIDGFPEQRGFCPLMQSMNRPTFLAIKNHSPDKPVIVFVASRRQTRLTAKDLINFCGMEDNPRRFLRMSEEDLQLNLQRVKDDALKEALNFGIGLHHAGLVETDRQLAEELFANNKIQVLVATSTLAWGVNLPAHLVIVKGTQFFDAKIEGYKDMDLTDVLQMLGRAGRPQFDDSGIARIFTQAAKKEFYKHFLHTGFPVESSLHKVLDDHLGAEVSAGTIVTKQDALDYLTWTFFFRRIHKNPSYYGLELPIDDQNTSSAEALVNDYMITLVDKSLQSLADSSCVQVHSNGDVDPTSFGKIMSYYYLSHKTIRHLLTNAKRNPSFSDVLAWMSCAAEFNDLPVRHNEDLINVELSAHLPSKADVLNLPMWDPHVKAFLLLQAYFSRIDLPISDYVGDQTSVLDQSVRIIQACIDVLTELGYLSAVLEMIRLLQCVKSARWPTDNPLSILPGVSPDAGSSVSDDSKRPLPPSLASVAGRKHPAVVRLMSDLAVPEKFHGAFERALTNLPCITLDVSNVTAMGVDIQIRRVNIVVRDWYQVYAPRFPKSQNEGYFAIIADSVSDEVLALKRFNWPSPSSKTAKTKGKSRVGNSDGHIANGVEHVERQRSGKGTKPTARCNLRVLGSTKERKVNIVVASDSYIDMSWRIDGVVIPAVPVVVDNGEKRELSV